VIRTSIDVRDSLGTVSDLMRRKSLQALADAAQQGKLAAETKARTTGGRQVSTFATVHAHADGADLVSGIRRRNPLLNIFDKGSLGKRTARLKHPGRRKSDWPVTRRGANPYTAHRGDTTGEGIAPLNVLTTARAAGRRALLAALRR